MPVLRPSGSDFTSFVKAAAQYVPAGRNAKPSKSGGVPVSLPGLGAFVRASQVGALASPTTSAVIINGITPPPPAAAVVQTWVNGGVVTTLAGSGSGTFADGTGTNASLWDPVGFTFLPDGKIAVGDWNNNRIRIVTLGGVVTTLAGAAPFTFADGTGGDARFWGPMGVVWVPSRGSIAVADSGNNCIRLVTYPGGVVTTLASGFSSPRGIALLSDGNLAVADTGGHRIRIVTPGGVVTTLAGSGSNTFADGTGTNASFWNPQGVAVLSDGILVVSDSSNNRIRLVTYPGGVVTTLAGSGSATFADGTGTAASFNYPWGIEVTPTGRILVADNNRRVRLITYPQGVVTTFAGSGGGYVDGTGTAAGFPGTLYGLTISPSGAIVLGDGNRIRLIT